MFEENMTASMSLLNEQEQAVLSGLVRIRREWSHVDPSSIAFMPKRAVVEWLCVWLDDNPCARPIHRRILAKVLMPGLYRELRQ